MASNSPIVEKLLVLLQQVVDEAQSKLAELSFDKDAEQQLYSVCLYSTILDMSLSCLTLLEEQRVAAVPILLRSFLEAYVDFINVIKDESYVRMKYAAYLEERIKIHKNILGNQTSPYFKDLTPLPDSQRGSLKKDQVELEQLKKEGKGPLNVWERFKRADLQNEYKGIYPLLCSHTHNSLSVLEDRHLEEQGSEGYCIVLFKKAKEEDLLKFLFTLGGVMINSSIVIHRLLKGPLVEEMQKFWEELEALHSLYDRQNRA